MKKETVKKLVGQTKVKAAGAMLAAAIVAGGFFAATQETAMVPEPVTYVDTYETVEVEEEEVPLAKATVTKSTKTKKSTKKIKLKKAAKKTYTSKGKTKTKKTTKTVKSSTATTKTQTVVKTQVASAYKKKSKICKRTTVTKTTVTKTVTPKASGSSSTTTKATSTASTTAVASTDTSISALAPKTDSRVVSAWKKLGFKFVINSGVSYSGLFDANTKTITLKKTGDTVYHELGHFLAYVAGNADMTSSFQQIFQEEKSAYTAYNKAYVLQDASEYFAESFKEYTLTPATLQQSRPKTYQAIQSALATLTDSYIAKLATLL